MDVPFLIFFFSVFGSFSVMDGYRLPAAGLALPGRLAWLSSG